MHAQDWDNAIIAMLDRCPSDKCFISHYPPAHNDTDSVQVTPQSIRIIKKICIQL